MKRPRQNYLFNSTIRNSLLFFFMCCIGLLSPTISLASHYSKQTKLNINLKNTTLEQFFEEVKRQSEFSFLYRKDIVEDTEQIDVHYNNATLEYILDHILIPKGFVYEIDDKVVIVREKEKKQHITKAKIQQQKLTITGNISDTDGLPIPFAAVCFKGTTAGCVASTEGVYSIKVPNEPGIQLEISSVGYVTKVIEINGKSMINVTLQAEVTGLSEVVVTGYQTISKERATGSFSVISSENIEASPNETIGANLESLVPGIQTTIDEEGNTKIAIRGESTLTSENNSPLIVVDGFAIDGGFETINRKDIEKITVLKDAAAASIWGARAANGVIVITSKKGSKKKGVHISFEGYIKTSDELDLDYANPIASSSAQLQYEKMMWQQSYGKPSKTIEDINNSMTKGAEEFQKQYDAYIDAGNTGTPEFTLDTPELQRLMKLSYKDQVKKHMIRRPISQNYNLNITGRGENNQYALSVMYNKNKEAMQEDTNNNILVNFRNALQLTNWLDVNVGIMTQFKERKSGGVGLNEIQNISPYELLLDENGNYNHINSDMYDKRIVDQLHSISDGWSYDNMTNNPLQNMRSQKWNTKTFNVRLNAGLNIKIAPGIKYSAGMQYMRSTADTKNRYLEESYFVRKLVNDYNVTDYNAFLNNTPQTITNHQISNGEIAYLSNEQTQAYVIRNQFNIDKTLGKHAVNFIAGTEVNWNTGESNDNWLYGYNHDKYTTNNPNAYTNLTRAYYPDNNLSNIQQGGKISYNTYKFFSLYSNLAYTYLDKYTVSGSIRTDASNITVKDAKYRYSPFWSVGGSWQIGKENFLNSTTWLDRLIIRGTYGVNGNIPMNTAQVPLISYIDGKSSYGAGVDYASLVDLGNPTLSWEKVKQLNVAVDYSLFSNTLFGSVELYNKNSYDLVAAVAMPSISGTDKQAFNVAELNNKGIEINLNARIKLGTQVSWHPTLNFAYNQSMVKNVNTSNLPLNDLYSSPYVEGYDLYPIWSYKLSGETNDSGIPLIEGKNGISYPANVNISNSGIYGPDAVWFRGSKVAPYVTSLTNEFKFKGFSLLTTFTGKFGHYMYNQGFSYNTRPDAMNFHKDLEYLVNGKANEIGMYPLPETSIASLPTYYSTSLFLESRIEDASFIRMKEIMLSYTMKGKLASKIGTERIKVYTHINNIGMLWTANDLGIDPEYPMGGSYFKPETTYTFGVNINF